MPKPPYKLEFGLPGLPRRTNNAKSHWAAKAKEAKYWKANVVWASRKVGLPKSPLKKARLTLIRYSSQCPDHDGLVSSFKHVIDGLILAKVLEDDSMEHIGVPDYYWEKSKPGAGSIVVMVEELSA